MAKRALCVGINEYKLDVVKDLSGCVNDARAWSTLLVDHFDFARDDVALLLDRQATRSALLDGLKTLLTGAKPGDVLVFTNSSHGSYNYEPGGGDEEPDAVDEVLCTHDYGEELLDDDQIRGVIADLPAGVRLTVVSDACHSGDSTRALAGDRPEDYRQTRSVNPEEVGRPALDLRTRGATLREAANAVRARFPEPEMKELLLSGCRPAELAQEGHFGGNRQGAMTYFAITAIQAADFRLTWRELHQRMDPRLQEHIRAHGFDPQHPQLEGSDANKDRQIFA